MFKLQTTVFSALTDGKKPWYLMDLNGRSDGRLAEEASMSARPPPISHPLVLAPST